MIETISRMKVTIVVLALLLHGFAHTNPPQNPSLPVEIYVAKEKEVFDIVHSAGVIKSSNSQYLLAEISGKLLKIHNFPDGIVKKGDLLAEIDNKDQQADYDAAKANLELAKLLAKRTGGLIKSGAASITDNDKAQAQLQIAQANFDKATTQLEKSKIRAPSDGIISLELKSPQDLMKIGDPIFHFEQLNPLEVEFALPKRLFNQVKFGNLVKYTIDDNLTTEGYITRISNVLSLDDESFAIKAIVANPTDKIMPGMFTSIDIICNQRNAIALPIEAVVQTNKGTNVYKLQDGQIAIAPVEKGSLFGDEVIITEGVKEGEQVIISGQMKLYPGMNAHPIATEIEK